jgi:uncharacterized protein YndB with AHSA1/START domain
LNFAAERIPHHKRVMPMKYQLTERFTHPPDRVFQLVTDVTTHPEWMPNVKRLEMLTDGDMQVGSSWRSTRTFFGYEGTEYFEVAAFDPPKRLLLRVDGKKGTSGRGEFRFDYHFEHSNGGTLLTLYGEIAGFDTLGKLAQRLFLTAFKAAVRRDHTAFRQHLDHNG